MNKSATTLKVRWTAGTLRDVFEVGKLQRLAEEDKVDVSIKWECGFTIERIEWLNGYDPDSPNTKLSQPEDSASYKL